MNDGAIISLAPGVIIEYTGTPLTPMPVTTRVLPGTVASVPGAGVHLRPLPAKRGSYRVTFKMATPPPLSLYVILFATNAEQSFLHALVIDDMGAIVIEGGSFAPAYIQTTNAPIDNGTLVTVTTAWDSENLLDNGFHVKVRVDGGGGGTTVIGDDAWTAIPLNQLYVGDLSSISPNPAFPDFIGRVQWSNRTDVF